MDVRTQMRRAAGFFAGHEAIVHGDTRLSFAEAWQRGIRFGNGLIAMGVKPGDRVAVLEDNCIEAADFYLGVANANAVRVPLYPRNGREAHLHMVGHTGCRFLVVQDKYAHEVEGLENDLPDLQTIFVRDGGYEAWLAAQSDVDPDLPIAPDDNYIIRHTGGTTGPSKGVAYTHEMWLAVGRNWFYPFPPVEIGDKCLHMGPISHGSGYFFGPTWLGGGCNVMADHFNALAAVDLMEREGIAYSFMVPTMVNGLLQVKGVENRDWSRLKVINIAAAPIADATALRAHEVFGDALYQLYGQTEALPVTAMSSAQWFADVEGSTPLRACGMCMPYAELEIRDEDNNPLPYGEEGELAVRCDGQMTGFWGDPQATRERLVDGWVLTGDVARIDRNGYVYLLDRANDMIVSGGYNIYPAELENALSAHPAVIEAAVFGVPHDKWGETPLAVCVVEDTKMVSEQELIELCATTLGSYKKPGRVELRTEPLPKSPVGKVKRKDLRDPHWAGRERRIGGA
ncbi:MAG: AMP-binding protein [Alphaproteobacteria bacterium]